MRICPYINNRKLIAVITLIIMVGFNFITPYVMSDKDYALYFPMLSEIRAIFLYIIIWLLYRRACIYTHILLGLCITESILSSLVVLDYSLFNIWPITNYYTILRYLLLGGVGGCIICLLTKLIKRSHV